MLGWSRHIFSITAILLVSEATGCDDCGQNKLAENVVMAVTMNATKRAQNSKHIARAISRKLDPGIDTYTDDLLKIILASPCKKDCFVTNKEWVKLHEKLVYHLTKLIPVTEEHKVKDTEENLDMVLNILMKKIEDSKQADSEILSMAAIKTVYKRKGEWPDVLGIFPDLKASTYTTPDNYDSADYQSARDPATLQFRVAEPENRMDYWREENELHMYHFAWHLQSGDHHPQNRRGERFFYMHRHMLLRYYTERHVLGIPETVPFSRQHRSGTFVSKYNVDANNEDRDTLQNFESAKEQCSMSDDPNRNDLDTQDADIDRYVSRARNIDDYSTELQFSYHNQGHNSISAACGSSGRHIMLSFQTSARDPLFYRWHTEVDLKVANYLSQRPYDRNALSPAGGVQVSIVEVHDARCGKVQQIETFWNEVIYDGQTFYGIDHDEFKLVIKLRNSERSRKRVIIRVFLGLEEHIGTGKWYMSIDKFTHQLTGQADETIDRSELQSTYTYSGKPYNPNSCGWPQRLLIPRGSDNQPSKFRFVVFVHDVENQNVNEGMTPETSNVLCGVNSRSIVTDPREYGFPFLREWQGYDIGTVMRNQDNAFGNVSTPIEISFKGQRQGGRRCGQSVENEGGELEPEACYHGHCYRTSANAVSWDKAESLCKRNGLDLVDRNVKKDSFLAMIKHEKNKRRNRHMVYWTRNKRPSRKYPGHEYCLAMNRKGKLVVGNCNKDKKIVHGKSGRSFEFIFRALCQKI